LQHISQSSTPVERQTATFVLRRGLLCHAGAMSLESVSRPGHFVTIVPPSTDYPHAVATLSRPSGEIGARLATFQLLQPAWVPPEGSKVLHGDDRTYVISPLSSIVDERYTVYFEFLDRASHTLSHSLKPRSPAKLRAERLGTAGAFACLFVLTVCMYSLLPAKVVSTRRGKRRRLRGALRPAHKRRWPADGTRGSELDAEAQPGHDRLMGFDHVATINGENKQLTLDAAPALEAMPQDITGSRTTPLSSLPVSLDEEYEMVE